MYRRSRPRMAKPLHARIHVDSRVSPAGGWYLRRERQSRERFGDYAAERSDSTGSMRAALSARPSGARGPSPFRARDPGRRKNGETSKLDTPRGGASVAGM